MKTLARLVVLLAILTICIPAQGEILIYSTLNNCWEALWDGVIWNINERGRRGFLILDVEYDGDEIVGINSAYQADYGRDLRWWVYWHYEEDYSLERIEVDGEVIWVIEHVFATDTNTAEIIMLRGKPKNMNIGLGRDAKREVVRSLEGYILYLDLSGMGDIEKEMCTMSLRLHGRWTKCANNPDECNQDFECAIFDVVIAWLEDKPKLVVDY